MTGISEERQGRVTQASYNLVRKETLVVVIIQLILS